MAEENDTMLQFLPFSSVVETTFWHQLTQFKIDVYALNEDSVDISGCYSNHALPRLPACFSVDYSAFDKSVQSKRRGDIICKGTLSNKNTIETFKETDKQLLLNQSGAKIWNAITTGDALKEPELLTQFTLLTFADLKKYQFYYWFGFPALVFPSKFNLVETPKTLDQVLTTEEISQLKSAYDDFSSSSKHSVFIIEKQDKFQLHPLTELATLDKENVWIGFCDPSSLPSNPGWPLRNILALIYYHRKELLPGLPIVCWRDVTRDGQRRVNQSLLLKIKDYSCDEETAELPKCLGWEKNDRGKMGPRLVNLAATMDPERLAETAVDLNLKLMKWRLLPELNLDVTRQTKCLLLGAGTLGCYVARTLMAWGVRHITFIDNGRVSYSNPVRQSLFNFENCLNGGQLKADCAGRSLKSIFPGMVSQGIDLRIPMPGHHVSDALKDSVEKDVNQLIENIDQHDVVFLLTDTRESRWLPTMLCAFKGKLVINAALGFDTYLVMRHGLRQAWQPGQVTEKSTGILRGALPGQNLGCYFCCDVVAPGDSTKDRTLDQQCTVTRPGISLIASGLAVELLVSVLQHPEKGNAAAEISNSAAGPPVSADSPLGLVPHSLRGFLHRHQLVVPATESFHNCTACSPLVLEQYAKDGWAFLLEVFNNPDYLEQVSGLADLHKDMASIEDWDYPEGSEASEDSL